MELQRNQLLRLLLVNDVYKPSKLSSLKTLARPYRPASFILAGDFLGGSKFACLHEGEGVVQVLNGLGLDYVVLGNHEFDFGEQRTIELIAKSKFKWLGSNVRINGELLPGVYDVDTFDLPDGAGKVGVFGVCTPQTPQLSHPTDAVVFEDPVAHAKRCVKELKARGCTIIIAVTHVIIERDRQIAEAVPEIDIILGGHEHTAMIFEHRGVLIMKVGQNADHLGVVDLFGAPGQRKSSYGVQMIPNVGIESDPEIDRVIAEWAPPRSSASEEVLTTVLDPVSTLTRDVRTRETAFACMLAEACKWSYRDLGCDLAVQNGGFVRDDTIYPVGTPLTVAMMQEEMPFPRTPTLLRMSGEAIKLALEQMIAKSPEPLGSFPHLSSGFNVEYSLERAPLDRIVSMSLMGAPMEPKRMYLLAISDMFVDLPGDGVTGFNGHEVVAAHKKMILDVVIEYLRTIDGLSGTPPGRMKRID